MSYWNIRKRARLDHLPTVPAEPVRGTVVNSDPRYLASVAWMNEYNRLRAQPETTNGHEKDHDDDDAASGDAEEPARTVHPTGD